MAKSTLVKADDADNNVVDNYRWTLTDRGGSDKYTETPYVELKEYEIDENTITRQLSYYGTGVANFGQVGEGDYLAPYEKLFPRTNFSNRYKLPYFSETNFQITSPVWASLDQLEQAAKFVESGMGALFGQGAADATEALLNGAANVVGAGLTLAYPKVGIMDRPKLWERHDFRTIEIKFPLFNTVGPEDWLKNLTFIRRLVTNNLYLKLSVITSLPPVYYEILIPGQHYSYAACCTNLTINNRGNMRRLIHGAGGSKSTIVPDAYEVVMTLTDMVMPSRNLFLQNEKKFDEIQVQVQESE